MQRRIARVAACTALLSLGSSAQDVAPRGRWEALPLPAGPRIVSDVAHEQGGDLWAVIGARIRYWDGADFRSPVGAEQVAEYYGPHLFGGGDRPLFAAQALPSENQGKIFRLSDGRVLFEADYYHENAHAPPSVYVSRTGQLFHFGDRFLAVRVGEAWERIEALLHHEGALVFETEEKVHFRRVRLSAEPAPRPRDHDRGNSRGPRREPLVQHERLLRRASRFRRAHEQFAGARIRASRRIRGRLHARATSLLRR